MAENQPFRLQLCIDVASVRQGSQEPWLATNVVCAYRYPWAHLSPRSNIEQEMARYLVAQLPMLETLGGAIARAEPIKVEPQPEPLELNFGLVDPSEQLEDVKRRIRDSASTIIASPRYGVFAIPSTGQQGQICLVICSHQKPGVGLYLAESYSRPSLLAFLDSFLIRTGEACEAVRSTYVFAGGGNQLAQLATKIAEEVYQNSFGMPQVVYDATTPLVLAALTRKK